MSSFLHFLSAVTGIAALVIITLGVMYLANKWNPKENPYKIRCETEFNGRHVYEFRSESCWTDDGRRIFMSAK